MSECLLDEHIIKRYITFWEAHLKLTYDELQKQTFDLHIVNRIHVRGEEVKKSLAFIPGYGLCREISHLDYTIELDMIHENVNDAIPGIK